MFVIRTDTPTHPVDLTKSHYLADGALGRGYVQTSDRYKAHRFIDRSTCHVVIDVLLGGLCSGPNPYTVEEVPDGETEPEQTSFRLLKLIAEMLHQSNLNRPVYGPVEKTLTVEELKVVQSEYKAITGRI